jgi:hypothetical protein
MDWLRHSFRRFRALFSSAALDNDLDVERASHLEMAVEENRNNGMSPEEARRQALLKFGGSTCAKEEHRLGIYGVISYSVTRQTQESGIRMALGASPKRVQWSVLCKTLRLALMGMAIGALASFAASKLIASLLFNIEASDPPLLSACCFCFLLSACWPVICRLSAPLASIPQPQLRFE